jgi:hypothetical protein
MLKDSGYRRYKIESGTAKAMIGRSLLIHENSLPRKVLFIEPNLFLKLGVNLITNFLRYKLILEGRVMKLGEEFIEGFFVLGFSMFVVGLLTGMLAIGLLDLKLNSTSLFIVFTLGFLAGSFAVALMLVSMKMRELKKTS